MTPMASTMTTEAPPQGGASSPSTVPFPPRFLGDTTGYTPQALPDGNPKTRFGVAKPPLSLVPALALVMVSEAFRDGAAKYGPANWRVDPVTTSTYLNAALRHIAQWQDGEEDASDSGVHHLGHAVGCLMILLDAQATGTLLDDRPPPAPTAAMIRAKTRPLPQEFATHAPA